MGARPLIPLSIYEDAEQIERDRVYVILAAPFVDSGHGKTSEPVAERRHDRNRPFLFLIGYSAIFVCQHDAANCNTRASSFLQSIERSQGHTSAKAR